MLNSHRKTLGKQQRETVEVLLRLVATIVRYEPDPLPELDFSRSVFDIIGDDMSIHEDSVTDEFLKIEPSISRSENFDDLRLSDFGSEAGPIVSPLDELEFLPSTAAPTETHCEFSENKFGVVGEKPLVIETI